MVGGYYVDELVVECLSECCSVFGCFDGGVALDECAECVVVFCAEHEMCDDGFGCYLFVFYWAWREEFEFFGCGDVGEVEACASVSCHLDGE